MILEFLDSDGKWKPLEKIPLTKQGDFQWEQPVSELGFHFPLGEEVIMRLIYLPSNLTNYAGEYLGVDYSNFNPVYKTTEPLSEIFTLFVKGIESKLTYIPTEFMDLYVNPLTFESRIYSEVTNEYERLQEGEPYTYLDVHASITDDYEFTFQLTDNDIPVQNSPVWMEIGIKPRAGTNFKLLDWETEDGNYPDAESLGTALFMAQGQQVALGPGVGGTISRMFTRPEEYTYIDPETDEEGEYSAYIWDYQMTDTDGFVTFNVNFTQDLIADFARIFDDSVFSSGTFTRDSLDDYRLYIRVFHAPVFAAEDMALSEASELLCSEENKVFDMNRISEFDGYDFSSTMFYDGSYAEGLITLYPEDVMLGVPNTLVYQLGSELNDSFSFDVEVVEANLRPEAELMTPDKLGTTFETSDLIPEHLTNMNTSDFNGYLIESMPVYATITNFSGDSPFIEGFVDFMAYIDEDGVACFNISDYWLGQLLPGVYQINIRTDPRIYTKAAYRYITLEVRSEYYLHMGKPTLELDLLNWFDSGWGGAYLGDEYLFYEDIYPRLTGYLATNHSEDGLEDYVSFTVYAKARDIGSSESWDDLDWISLGDEDVFVSSLVYDGLYYFEYPLGFDGEMLLGKEVMLNITVDGTYNQSGMIADSRTQALNILNLTLITSTIRNDTELLDMYSDSDTHKVWIGDYDTFGVERYFEYTDDVNTYGIDSEDVLLNMIGYVENSIEVVEVRGQQDYREVVLAEGESEDYIVQNEYEIVLDGETSLDNYSDLIISYAVKIDASNVLEFSFSEADGFIHSAVILDTDTAPIELAPEDYLGMFYSKFNESYELVSNAADLNIGFTGISTSDVRIFSVKDSQGQLIEDNFGLEVNGAGNQISIEFDQISGIVSIEYGIATYQLDRGYQQIEGNFTDSVRKLTKLHSTHKIHNYSSSTDMKLFAVPEEPEDPFGSNNPSILIPMLEENATRISFEYLALTYNTKLSGTFALDECVMNPYANNTKPIYTTFTITTEDREEFFDFLTIDPGEGQNEIDFEINLQPIFALKGYTTFDIAIDFVHTTNRLYNMQYVILKSFNLTSDDRILQTVSTPIVNKDGSLDVLNILNSPNWVQIFTSPLHQAFDVLDDSWLTIAVEGFNDYGELVRLNKNGEDILFNPQANNEYFFQSLEQNGRILTESLGFYLNATDLKTPEYVEGEVNLYKGKGAHMYGEVYEYDREMSMNWQYSDYTADTSTFDASDYNSDNFFITERPLTSNYMYVEGEVYMHHRFDLTNTSQVITTGLPSGVEFAVIIPNETVRLSSVEVEGIERVCAPWDWVESWQGYSLTSEDYATIPVYNEDNLGSYSPSSGLSTSSYELVVNDEGMYQLNFFSPLATVKTSIGGDMLQVDFHISHVFSEFSDYEIVSQPNTYNCELQWNFPPSSGYSLWTQYPYHPDLSSSATFNMSYAYLSEYAPIDDFKSTALDTFQFYPNEYNFTTFEFEEFDDDQYEVTLDLSGGGEFQNRFDQVKPFGFTIQTKYGERYLEGNFLIDWTNSTYGPTYTFYLDRDTFEMAGILKDSEVQVTYYYPKETYEYHTSHDDILYGGGFTFVIKDSQGTEIKSTYIESISGYTITFKETVQTEGLLDIGEEFSVAYDYKTRGGLIESKHMFYEIQPREMTFYNNYYPFSGGSIISPLYYNFSSKYQYQLALNYRMHEKPIITQEVAIEEDLSKITVDLGENLPILSNNEPLIAASLLREDGSLVHIESEDLDYNDEKVEVDLNEYRPSIGTLYVSVFDELHNKYLYYHDFAMNWETRTTTLANWNTAQSLEDTLLANLESTHFLYGDSVSDDVSQGKVKQVYAILNETNSLTYTISEELSDESGWGAYDTLIMRMGILNVDVLSHITIEFKTGSTTITTTQISPEMIEEDTVYLNLPDSASWGSFTEWNDAKIVFTPVFYNHSDFEGYFYGRGLPVFQMVEWASWDVEDGEVQIDLEHQPFSTDETVYLFDDSYEFIGSTTIGSRTETSDTGYELEYYNITLNDYYIDQKGNKTILETGDILYLKYNATLDRSIGIVVEDMCLQKGSYIENYMSGQGNVPIAEITLLGEYNDANTYTVPDDLHGNRDKVVAWEQSLELTPFESEFQNTFRQCILNVSFDDINSGFIITEDGIDYSYMTDIMITSNDPRYEIIIDSLFLFEFDSNATLYDSEIFDIYANNHMQSFYFGEFSNIYDEFRMLTMTNALPLYYNDYDINESDYWDVWDSVGNWYYIGEQLNAVNTSTGVYNITWNPDYSGEYYSYYTDVNATQEEIDEYYEYYNPHIDQFRYICISWADEDAWKEWHTIESPNVNISTLDLVFEYYNSTSEAYESITYDLSTDEFEARNIAVEVIYPYAANNGNSVFDLSQDYSNAQNLEFISTKGYYYNECEVEFSITPSLESSKDQILLTSDHNLNETSKIIVLIAFTEGAYSDYTQFRLLQNAIDNHPTAPQWTKNDSIYVDFEYTDIDYFLLVEDYAVGSEDSLFEHLIYTRSNTYASYSLDTYTLQYNGLQSNFKEFTAVPDTSSKLEFMDFDMDCTHEIVTQSDDITRDGNYDSVKTGYVNSAGEISFESVIQKASYTQVDTGKEYNSFETERFDFRDGKAVKRRFTTTKTTTRYTTYGIIIQEDLNLDGDADEEVSFEVIVTSAYVETFTVELINLLDITATSDNIKIENGTLIEHKESQTSKAQTSMSYVFQDYVDGEVNSTRYYKDAFPNELAEKYNLQNHLVAITNDMDDEDETNDVSVNAVSYDGLLSLSYENENVPAVFDSRISVEGDEINTENILEMDCDLSIPKGLNYASGTLTTDSGNLKVIEVIPEEGVYYDNAIGEFYYNQVEKTKGKYYYFDGEDDGTHETIFITDMDSNILGVAFDYDGNSLLEPNKKQVTKRNSLYTDIEGVEDEIHEERLIRNLSGRKLLGFNNEKTSNGVFLERTFSDAMFDLWKMEYTEGTSRLIKETKKITSHQFLRTLTPGKIASDITTQVVNQLIALGVGTVLGIASEGNAAVFMAGYMITYWILSAITGYDQEKQMRSYLKSQTYHNADYEGEVTLSKMKFSHEVSDVMSAALTGSEGAVYKPVESETSTHKYVGKLVLAPNKMSKTRGILGEVKRVNLDYSAQTRGYLGYSDFDDPNFCRFFLVDYFDYEQGLTLKMPRIEGASSYKRTYMFLEEAVSQQSLPNDHDLGDRKIEHFDRILPYMMSTQPMLAFANSYTQVSPEFYLDYPLFVSEEEFEEVEEEYHTVYKVFDPSQKETTPEIHILPENSVYFLISDIQDVIIYYVRVKNGQKIHEEVVQDFTLQDSDYTINNMTGTFKLSDDMFNLMGEVQSRKDAGKEEEGFTSFYVFEFHIEKYRSVDNLKGLSSKEVDNIAAMQEVHANILEYMYYQRIAEKTQQKMSQIAYTSFVTAISTLITLPASIMAGAYMGFLKEGAAAASEGGKAVSKTFTEYLTKQVNEMSLKTLFRAMIKPFAAVISEVKDEIFIDPIIESYVSKATENLGLWSQTLLTTLAESGRETAFSAMSMGFQYGYQSAIHSQLNNMISQNEMATTTASQQEMTTTTASQQETSYSRKATVAKALELSMSALSLFGPLLGMLAGGGIGMSMMAGFSLMGSMDIELSKVFEASAKQYHMIYSNLRKVKASAVYDSVQAIASLQDLKSITLQEDNFLEISRHQKPVSATISENINLLAQSRLGVDFNEKNEDHLSNTVQNGKVNSESRLLGNSKEKTQFLKDLVNEILNVKEQKGRSSFVLTFKGEELNSPLEVLKKYDIDEIQSFVKETLLRGIDPNLEFSFTLADQKSRLSKSKAPDGRVLLDESLIDVFKDKLLNNIKALTGKSLQELRSITPKAYYSIKNYFENSIYKKNKDFAEKYLKEGFFDMLLDYYLKYELPAQIWASYVESESITKQYFRDKYFQTWDANAKKLQKIIWGVLLDFRNPYNSERIQSNDGSPDVRTWMSSKIELHHWLTAEGTENKYKCFWLALVPLPKSQSLSSFVHNKITKSLELLKSDDLKLKEKGEDWENRFAIRISDILQGKFPTGWNEDVRSEVKKYQTDQTNENARNIILWFLLNPQVTLMRDMGIDPSKFLIKI
jgi:hypothetical protein